jgi:hypothetical protein
MIADSFRNELATGRGRQQANLSFKRISYDPATHVAAGDRDPAHLAR